MAIHPGFLGSLGWDPAGGTSYTTIAQVRDLSGPSISRNDIEIADRSQTTYYKEYRGGMVDPGSITFDLTWDPISTNSHAQTAGTGLMADLESENCTLAAFQWQVDGCGGTATMTFDGYVNSFEISAPLEEVLTASVGIKISGKPTLAIT